MSVSLETLALAKKYAKNNIPSSAEPIDTDKTLSVLGAPADAKITGDRLNEVETDFFDLKEALRVNLLELLSNAAYTEDDMSQYYNDLATALGEEILVGITAVFNQGANKVYAVDGLDSLKQYLTVSARYSDGTSTTLQNSDYTLSGTLSEGVSTITVSYDDSTTTFDVTVSSLAADSITAVFNKGSNNVYSGDDIESLKQYLTVTAHYSDNSSRIIQSIDYTLSGTLTEGTSTITVSYDGETTTFDVPVESVSLNSIGAVFNKGSNNVYSGDDLESLKQYLTVTAYYSNDTTDIVPSSDYTLYGDLDEGINTITVLYSSKAATFNVEVSQNTTEFP